MKLGKPFLLVLAFVVFSMTSCGKDEAPDCVSCQQSIPTLGLCEIEVCPDNSHSIIAGDGACSGAVTALSASPEATQVEKIQTLLIAGFTCN